MKYDYKKFLPGNLLDLLEEYVPDIFYIGDFPARKYMYIGSSTPTYLGYDSKQVGGENSMSFCFSLIHPSDREAAFKQLIKFEDAEFRSKDTPSVIVEYRMKHAEGHYVWMQSREYIIEFTEEGKIKHTLGMAKCIDAKKKKEDLILTNLDLKETAKDIYTQYSEKKKGIAKISYREIEIMELLTQGLSSKIIAARLYISPETVETHRKNILKKLGVKNTAESIKLFCTYKRL